MIFELQRDPSMGCKGFDFLSFPEIDQCSSEGREKQIVAADLDGILVKGRSSFPYFMLVAFETRGLIRAVLLLILYPIAWLLHNFVSESAGIKLLIYVSFAGVKASEIEAVGRAVLPKFYLDDLHHGVWRSFSAFGKRILVTSNPRIMVENFAKEYLGVDRVIGTEIELDCKGRATGFVLNPGVLVGERKRAALRQAMGEGIIDVGFGERKSDEQFMNLCMEAYRVGGQMYAKSKEMEIGEGIFAQKFAKPVVFHDGRLVQRPTPAISLITLLWFPFGFIIAIIRIAAGSLLPMNLVFYAFWVLGVRVVIKGNPPSPKKNKSGVLFVCSHRSLLDPIFLSAALGRPVTAVTYSISRLSELLSPIKTVRLTRNRSQDAENIKNLLEQGDLAICPEGTTCREPFLLRFSSLFAELSDQIVPVAMNNKMSMFHGTSARGWKGMDPFFYFMNPSPVYEVTFLDQVPVELTCSGGRNSHEVANYIQRVLAGCLSFECTSFTRKDKYRVLAGHDGVFPSLNKK